MTWVLKKSFTDGARSANYRGIIQPHLHEYRREIQPVRTSHLWPLSHGSRSRRRRRLWDSTGKCYLDFCAGIATCVLGHCHPAVTQALQKQAATLVHCSNLYQIPQQADLAEFIVTKCVERPGKVFFSNSGAESNDGLIKVARRYGHRRPSRTANRALRCLRSTSPSTAEPWAACPATGQDKIKIGFDPMLPRGSGTCPSMIWRRRAKPSARKRSRSYWNPFRARAASNSVTPEFLRGLAEPMQEA